ncbi:MULTISPECIES: gluconolaconase [Actinomadura]|uniref:Gluconolaconase n=1 Tax=Actinomadura yumaensis TaxID=111807 RepID=A0ABW2CNU8_9ACTN|nr:gluconolaconase [Actinomadura sp. J1-007]MWK36599.1 gluconolaconase [Actinomadura sp. J1-007]
MAGNSTENTVGTAYIGDVFMRHPLTTQNQQELELDAKAGAILRRNEERGVLKRTPKDGKEEICPVGFSLNEKWYGRVPAREQTAHERGWYAYLNVGVPLIEERSDIEQPPPDLISKQTYINGTDPIKVTVTDTVEFEISNTISWSLAGEVKLTFGARTSTALQQQLAKSMAMKQHQKSTQLSSKDRLGGDSESQTEMTSTTTATGSATGTGELWGDLMLGITGSISGSLTTAWKHQSSVSVEISSRVDVLATTRRQVRTFDYQIPITFGGWVALYYDQPVRIPDDTPQDKEPEYSHVIAWKLGERSKDNGNFDLADEGKRFMQKGIAEMVAVRTGEHRVFQPEKLDFPESKERPQKEQSHQE